MSNGPFKKKIYPDNYTNEYNTSEGVLASLLFQKQCTGQGFGLLKGEIQTKKPSQGPEADIALHWRASRQINVNTIFCESMQIF